MVHMSRKRKAINSNRKIIKKNSVNQQKKLNTALFVPVSAPVIGVIFLILSIN